jgi:hypothetical protein
VNKLVLVDPFENNPALKYGLMADGSAHAQVCSPPFSPRCSLSRVCTPLPSLTARTCANAR